VDVPARLDQPGVGVVIDLVRLELHLCTLQAGAPAETAPGAVTFLGDRLDKVVFRIGCARSCRGHGLIGLGLAWVTCGGGSGEGGM